MAILEDMFKGDIGTTLLVGVAATAAAPLIVPGLSNLLRPVAKAVIKGGILAYDQGREAVAQLGEAASDIAAEARAELTSREAGTEQAATDAAS
jgi:hypothetical protein